MDVGDERVVGRRNAVPTADVPGGHAIESRQFGQGEFVAALAVEPNHGQGNVELKLGVGLAVGAGVDPLHGSAHRQTEPGRFGQ